MPFHRVGPFQVVRSFWALAGLLALAPSLGQAQAAPAQPQSLTQQTGQPQRLLTVPDYVSPLGQYQKYTPAPNPDWVKANETVHQRGGWRVYSREQAPKPEGSQR